LTGRSFAFIIPPNQQAHQIQPLQLLQLLIRDLFLLVLHFFLLLLLLLDRLLPTSHLLLLASRSTTFGWRGSASVVDLHVAHSGGSDGHVLIIWVVGSDEVFHDALQDFELGFEAGCSGAETGEGESVG
jgi:hypothetical protein